MKCIVVARGYRTVGWRSQATENLAGKGYKPEGKSPEVEEKLSHTLTRTLW